jgi:hypothetical protein
MAFFDSLAATVFEIDRIVLSFLKQRHEFVNISGLPFIP